MYTTRHPYSTRPKSGRGNAIVEGHGQLAYTRHGSCLCKTLPLFLLTVHLCVQTTVVWLKRGRHVQSPQSLQCTAKYELTETPFRFYWCSHNLLFRHRLVCPVYIRPHVRVVFYMILHVQVTNLSTCLAEPGEQRWSFHPCTHFWTAE